MRKSAKARQRSRRHGPRFLVVCALTFCFLGQGGSARAVQREAEWSGFKDPLTLEALAEKRRLEEHVEPIRAGHAALAWEAYPGAAAYRVVDASDMVFYEGRMSEAFISGLPDGDHVFRLQALNAAGDVIAEGPQRTVLVVEHWPMWMSISLLSVGAVVVLAMIGVLLTGMRRSQRGAW